MEDGAFLLSLSWPPLLECVVSGSSSRFSHDLKLRNFQSCLLFGADAGTSPLPQKVIDKNLPFEVFIACFPEFLLLV